MYVWLFYAWFRNKNKSDRSFTFPVMCGVAGVLVTGFFGYPLHRPSISVTMAVLMGISIKPSGKEIIISYNKILNGILVLFGLFLVYLKINEQIVWEKGRKYFEKNKMQKAGFYTDEALNYSLLPGKIYFLQGRIFYRMKKYSSAL